MHRGAQQSSAVRVGCPPARADLPPARGASHAALSFHIGTTARRSSLADDVTRRWPSGLWVQNADFRLETMIAVWALRGIAATATTSGVVTVAFTIRDNHAGFDVRGRVHFGGASVVLELERRTEAPAAIERKVVIDIEEFAACSFRRGVLGARLQLWALDEGALGGVPGAADDGVLLQFSRNDRDAAEALALRVRSAIDEAVTRTGDRGLGLSPSMLAAWEA